MQTHGNTDFSREILSIKMLYTVRNLCLRKIVNSNFTEKIICLPLTKTLVLFVKPDVESFITFPLVLSFVTAEKKNRHSWELIDFSLNILTTSGSFGPLGPLCGHLELLLVQYSFKDGDHW